MEHSAGRAFGQWHRRASSAAPATRRGCGCCSMAARPATDRSRWRQNCPSTKARTSFENHVCFDGSAYADNVTQVIAAIAPSVVRAVLLKIACQQTQV